MILVVGVILGISIFLGVLFYPMYCSFHDDLPKITIIIAAIFIGILAILGVVWLVFHSGFVI